MLRSAALSFALALAPGLALSAPVPTAPKTRPAATTRPTTREDCVGAKAASPPQPHRGGSGTLSGSQRQQVEKLLRATERPPGPADLNSIGASAEDALIAIAGDKTAEAVLRARATSAMAHAASPRARAFLMDVVTRGATQDPATATATDRLLLRRAAVALGWQGGPGAPLPLGHLLAHPDPEVRTDAAVGLGLTRLAPAANLLRNHLALEKDARVRGHVSRQLQSIETSLGLDPTRPVPAPTDPEAVPATAETATDLPRAGTRRRAPAPPPPTRMQPNRSRF